MEEKASYPKNDKEDAKKYVESSFRRLHHDILSLIQVLCKNEYQYSQVRAQVLRTGNNALRDILAEIDTYRMESIPSAKRTRIENYSTENEEV